MIWPIRERAAFARLAQDGRRTRAGVLWCNALHDPSATPPRVAFAIGRAVGPAVTRNLIRRRLRALLRDAPLLPGWYLIGVRPDAAGQSFAELSSDLASLVDRCCAPRPVTSPSSDTRSSPK